MHKSFGKLLLLFVLTLFWRPAFALDFEEMYENALRAHKMSRWGESIEIFDRILELWPKNKKNSEIHYYRAIGIINSLESAVFAHRLELLKDATKDIETIFLDHSELDLSELKAAEELFKQGGKAADWAAFSHIKPDELKHILLKGWHPQPQAHPMEALRWLCSYKDAAVTPTVTSLIELTKVKAMWQLLLSPLVAEEYQEELKQLGLFPLSEAFEKSLNKGFRLAEPSIKREFAQHGFHYDYLKKGMSDPKQGYKKSKWLAYLKQRGLVSKEALCPY
jgi:hypothetical protein